MQAQVHTNACKFKDNCDGLKGHIFDSTGYDRANTFAKTLEQVANYAGQNYAHGVTMAKTVEKLMQPLVTMPTTPSGGGTDRCDPTNKHVCEREVNEAIPDKKDIDQLMQKLCALVMGQCTKAMMAQMEALHTMIFIAHQQG